VKRGEIDLTRHSAVLKEIIDIFVDRESFFSPYIDILTTSFRPEFVYVTDAEECGTIIVV